MPNDVVGATITAQNTWTDWLSLSKGDTATLSISGTFSATVTLQRRLDGVNARAVETWTAPAEADYYASEGQEIRLGVATGGFTSGSAVLRIGS